MNHWLSIHHRNLCLLSSFVQKWRKHNCQIDFANQSKKIRWLVAGCFIFAKKESAQLLLFKGDFFFHKHVASSLYLDFRYCSRRAVLFHGIPLFICERKLPVGEELRSHGTLFNEITREVVMSLFRPFINLTICSSNPE